MSRCRFLLSFAAACGVSDRKTAVFPIGEKVFPFSCFPIFAMASGGADVAAIARASCP
ncbi:hypothetical protein PSP6_60063 [Paraburkholderia tropica]|nr:hypothetical protein PSP6_60063 [Paraburkholderia tropica]